MKMLSNIAATVVLAVILVQDGSSIDIPAKMNTKINPCDDFYQFACGKYIEQVKLADGEVQRDGVAEAQKAMNDRLKASIRDPNSPKNSKVYDMVKKLYRACMNVDALEKLGLEPLKQLLKSSGGMPMIEGGSWKADSYDWVEQRARLLKDQAFNKFFTFGVVPDYEVGRDIVNLDQPALELLNRDFYLDAKYSKQLEALRTAINSIAVLLGADKDRAKNETDALIAFETQIANISSPEQELNRTKMTVGESKKRFPKLPLDKWFSTLRKLGWDIKDDQSISVRGVSYFDKLGDLVAKTDKRTLANYEMVAVALYSMALVAPSLRKPYEQYQKDAFGRDPMPRDEECVSAVLQRRMDWPLSAIFAREHLNLSSRAEVKSIYDRVANAMNESLSTIQWLDNVTRQRAINKLSKITPNIAYPDQILDDAFALRDYNGIVVDDQKFLDSRVSLWKRYWNMWLRRMNETITPTSWLSPPVLADDYYVAPLNAIFVHSGILNEPFFVIAAPSYYNYGGVGENIGKDIMDAFNENGRQYDENGKKNVWWTNETMSKFELIKKCFVDQYSGVKDDVTGLNFDGKLQFDFNVAANAAIRLAYLAYKAAVKDKPSNDTLNIDGKQYTQDQLFFIVYAQTYCQVARPEYRSTLIKSSPRTPNDIRVRMPLKNFEKFSDAFQCPQGSPMNPKDRCIFG